MKDLFDFITDYPSYFIETNKTGRAADDIILYLHVNSTSYTF